MRNDTGVAILTVLFLFVTILSLGLIMHSCEEGTEFAECYANHTCDKDLTCVQNGRGLSCIDLKKLMKADGQSICE